MSEEVKVPFFNSMVTVSLAHFMRNLDLGGVKDQQELVGIPSLEGMELSFDIAVRRDEWEPTSQASC